MKGLIVNTEFELDTSTHVEEFEDNIAVDPKNDWIENYQGELDAYYAAMQQLNQMLPSLVMQKLSSWSARASEIRSQLVRVDSRRSTAFRTREVDPFLTECDRQFKIHSRIESIRDLDWKMAGGQF